MLREVPAGREVAVVAEGETAPERILVAYLAYHEGRSASTPELREHLGRRLPHYMIPGKFRVVHTLPLTRTGKIDRRQLSSDTVRAEPLPAAGRTDLEDQLIAIWKEVLRTEAVGIHDNFFAVGGHSLLVVQVNARVQQALGIDLPIRCYFESPTIAELAPLIVHAQSERLGAEEVSRILGEVEQLTTTDGGPTENETEP